MCAKNIILLSDGTGNGAAKKAKTNIWRLYRALNLHEPNQIAFYDDGVGAQEFLPLKILGGAFGYGMKRNVIELYKFLCRNYKPGDKHKPGDKIYLFGFSRGAFTARVLASMTINCGLYTKYKDDDDLHKTARKNYSAFRTGYNHGLLSRAFRCLFRLNKDPKFSEKPDIEFIGVWDTVDAYGLPIDELAILWDRLIFPIRFPNFSLSKKVNRACHAISVDDERHTFHPILWDEENDSDPKRIEQVWFSGMHSDVGGGYPMNDLSLVSLDWMITKVEKNGLHFISERRKEIRSHADWHGAQHDSRSGFAAYYRYKPRDIKLLCNDEDNKIKIAKPKIHRGVFERIQRKAVPYAPTALPKKYEVVSTRDSAPNFEPAPQNKDRAGAQKYALDVIYWRRWLYAALLATTFALVASRSFLEWEAGGICIGAACVLDPLLEFAIDYLPDFAAGWFEALRQNPGWLIGFIIAFTILYCLKRVAWKATQSKATNAWSALKEKKTPPIWTSTCTSRLRAAAQSKLRKAVKWTMAIGVFLLIFALILVLLGRVSFYVRSTLGTLCKNSASLTAIKDKETVDLDIIDPCHATGIALEKGKTYSFSVTPDDWTDGTIPAGPGGLKPSAPRHLVPYVPFRRKISENWFKLMGRIDDAGKEDFVIGSGVKKYKARSNGELFLYVNDAVFGLFPGRYWSWPYFWEDGVNKGTAKVTIKLLDNKYGAAGSCRHSKSPEDPEECTPPLEKKENKQN